MLEMGHVDILGGVSCFVSVVDYIWFSEAWIHFSSNTIFIGVEGSCK